MYRILKEGEVIKKGDEYKHQMGALGWHIVYPDTIGLKVGEYKGAITGESFIIRRKIPYKRIIKGLLK